MVPVATRADRRSWISPDARRKKPLFFESDTQYETVEMFSLPDLKFKGAVAGFVYPEGLCSDAAGNVWVADEEHVVELSHSRKILQSLFNSLGYAVSCAVNPKNGDLAVANIMGYSYAGMVLIFPKASGIPRVLACRNLANYYFVGYDPHGVLYVAPDGAMVPTRELSCRRRPKLRLERRVHLSRLAFTKRRHGYRRNEDL